MSVAATVRLPLQGKHARQSRTIKLPLLQENPIQLFLITLTLVSSLGLIYIKDLNRRLFIQYQKTENAYVEKTMEHRQLVLEKTTWSSHHRIQVLASEKLGMMLPSYDQTTVINTQKSKNHLIHASKSPDEKPARL